MADGTLKVGTITTSSGSGTITLGQSGETVTIPSGVTMTGMGKVLQVVSTTKTDTFSQSGTSTFADVTGLSVSITPSSASNKILIFASISSGVTATKTTAFRLVRDSTPIGGGTASGSRQSAIGQAISNDNNHHENVAINYLDSPSTTSATVYKIQMISQISFTGYVNRSPTDYDDAEAYSVRTSSTITAMEIAG